jgi:AcrR family transcriptional regulator
VSALCLFKKHFLLARDVFKGYDTWTKGFRFQNHVPEQIASSERHNRAEPAASPFGGSRMIAAGRPLRERMLEAMLAVSGERGYEKTAVEHVIERAQTSRASFYKHFESKADCFVQADAEASEWLYRRLKATAQREIGWRAGVRAALAELLEYCAREPATARALFVEVHAAGGQALARHNELLERLARELDGARPADPNGRPRGAMMSDFIIGAVETVICAKLMDGGGGEAPKLLPGLLYFVSMQYLGEEAAWEEMAAAPQASWSSRRRAAGRLR